MLSNLLEVTQPVTMQDSHLGIPDSEARTLLPSLMYLHWSPKYSQFYLSSDRSNQPLKCSPCSFSSIPWQKEIRASRSSTASSPNSNHLGTLKDKWEGK